MIENHHSTAAAISMAVRRFEIRNPYGVVRTDGEYVQDIEEKPIYVSQVNTGVYVLSTEALGILQPNRFCNMTDLVQIVIDSGKPIAAFPVHESWMDIGTPSDFHSANEI
jgi:NDP-sugar pyrophosphorylase family protein